MEAAEIDIQKNANANSLSDLTGFLTTNYKFFEEKQDMLFFKINAHKLGGNGYTDFLKEVGESVDKFKLDNIKFPEIKFSLQGIGDTIVEAGTEMVQDFKSTVNLATNIATGEIGIYDSIANALTGMVNTLQAVNDKMEDGANASQNTEHSWWLPLPNQLKNAIQHTYVENHLDPLKKILGMQGWVALNVINDIGELLGNSNISSNSLKSKTASYAATAIKYIGKSMTATFKAAQIAKEKALSAMGVGIEVAKRYNNTIDTNIVNVYTGTNTRHFSFNFNIIPMSRQHANYIVFGLLKLKEYMTGIRNGNHLIIQDNVFTIEIMEMRGPAEEPTVNNLISGLMFLDNCYLNLVNINITYGSDGALMLFHDGMPKSITIQLDFEERKPLYRTE